MRTVLVVGTFALLASMISGCNNSSAPTAGGGADNATAIVGVWKCLTKEGASGAGLSENQTFTADGWYSSSQFPEGKKYKYRLKGDELVIAMSYGDWTQKVTRLTNNALEYNSGKADQPTRVSCQK